MSLVQVLLIEDDNEIARLTKLYLEAEGYQVTVIHSGATAVSQIVELKPDVVLLDLMLPDKDGAQICREVREHYQGMILVLTAVTDELSEVSLLKLGADDYITKPIRGHVLVARIEALLRRLQRSTLSSPKSKTKLEGYGLSLCTTTQKACYREKELDLTQSEFEVLTVLLERLDQVVSREECCQTTRGIEYSFNDRSIDMRVSGLRKKLQKADVTTAKVTTIRNRGYKLTAA